MIRCTSGDDPWQCTVTNGDDVATADTTTRNGAGDGFGPHELLEAALASCLAMTVRMEADEADVDLESVTTAVSIRRDADLTAFEYAIDLDGVTGQEAEALRDAASRCPVRRTLSKRLDFEDAGEDVAFAGGDE